MAGAAGGKPPAATRPETQPYSQWLGDVIYVRRDDARLRQPARSELKASYAGGAQERSELTGIRSSAYGRPSRVVW